MHNRRLISALATVVAFWWTVIALYSIWSRPIPEWTRELAHLPALLSIMAGAGIVAGVIIATLQVLRHHSAVVKLRGETARGLICSLGQIPHLLPVPRRARRTRPREGLFKSWLLSTSKDPKLKHYSALGQAILDTMNDVEARATPASPIPGGHGGATLIVHSLNVADTVLEVAPNFTYEGQRNRKGKIMIPVQEMGFKLASNDPLIPLCGIAHDLGKLSCYKYEKSENAWKTVRYRHDEEGGHLLGRIPEFWEIPPRDREDLVLAVSYYHHPLAIPRKGTDRTRALMNLLMEADILASSREGGDVSHEYEDELPDEQEEFPPSERLWEAFYEIITAPGAVNGAKRPQRIATKYDDLVYIADPDLRQALATHFSAPSMMTRSFGDGTFQITRKLLEVLISKGVCYNVHQGKEYGPARAIFTTEFIQPGKDNDPESVIFRTECIIISLSDNAFPKLSGLGNAKLIPRIVKPTFGSESARNKMTPSSKTTASTEPSAVTSNELAKFLKVAPSEPETSDVLENSSSPASQQLAFDAVLHVTKSLEAMLGSRLDARGKGLHEKLTSVEAHFPPWVQTRIRYYATMRNRLMHEEGFRTFADLKIHDPNRFTEEAENFMAQLQTKIAEIRTKLPPAERVSALPVPETRLGHIEDDEVGGFGELPANAPAGDAPNLLAIGTSEELDQSSDSVPRKSNAQRRAASPQDSLELSQDETEREERLKRAQPANWPKLEEDLIRIAGHVRMLYKNGTVGSRITIRDIPGDRKLAVITAAALKAMRSTTRWDLALGALFERKDLGLPAPSGFGAQRPTEANPDWSLVVDLQHTWGVTAKAGGADAPVVDPIK